MNLAEIQTRIENLPLDEQNLIFKQLFNLINELDVDIVDLQQKSKDSQKSHCPHCQSHKTVKIGKHNGVQRYACKECKCNFRNSTGTFNVGLRKGKGEILKVYMKSFLEGDSIRTSAQKAGVSIPTSFKWRHRLLAALQNEQELTILEGIVESDDVFIAYSEKGNRNLQRAPRKRGKGVHSKKSRGISDEKVAVIVSQDRKGKKHLEVATRGRISEANLNEVLKDKIKKESILCTDTHHSYIAFAKTNQIEHITIKASAKEFVKENKFHIQNVNQTTKEMKKWLDGFNGVATKYLQNYLNWYSVMKKLENAKIPLRELAIMV